ncbi:hypothetical protein D3C80_2040410 [compost metagenome]
MQFLYNPRMERQPNMFQEIWFHLLNNRLLFLEANLLGNGNNVCKEQDYKLLFHNKIGCSQQHKAEGIYREINLHN